MVITATVLSIALYAFHSGAPLHLTRVAPRGWSRLHGRAASMAEERAPSSGVQPDVTSAAEEVASLLAGKIEVAHVDHVRDWLPEAEALPTPFHGGCVVDVRTSAAALEVAEQCVVPEPGADGAFVDEHAAVLTDPTVLVGTGANPLAGLAAWKAGGPRESVYFSPSDVRAAIVTCGGLCPGLNTVVKELVHCLREQYGVDEVYGVRNGYKGFYSGALRPLTLADVETIHREAGSVLGSSRGGHDTAQICDAIEAAGVNLVFTVGGDGTARAPLSGSDAVSYAHLVHPRLACSRCGPTRPTSRDRAPRSSGASHAPPPCGLAHCSPLATATAATAAARADEGIQQARRGVHAPTEAGGGGARAEDDRQRRSHH